MRQTPTFYTQLFQIVTAKKLYSEGMNILLLSTPALGMLWTILLFLVCFIGTHVAILAQLGWDTQHQKSKTEPEEKTEEKKATPEKQAEPIYYIVERKTRRTKPTYSEPKQINFKGQN